MNRRILFTRATHTTVTAIFLLLTIHTPLFAPPHNKRTQHQDATLQQSPPPSPKHKRHCELTTNSAKLKSLLATTPETFQHDNGEKLLHAIDLFHDVPGFALTLKKALNQARQSPLAHGYMYEIETALTMQEVNDDPVCSFGKEHLSTQSHIGNHEIDIETRHFHIECKDVFWNSRHLLSSPEKIQRQLSEQRTLIEEENRKADTPKSFLLCSKQPIPSTWKKWLEEQSIAYECPGDSSYSSDQSSHASDS